MPRPQRQHRSFTLPIVFVTSMVVLLGNGWNVVSAADAASAWNQLHGPDQGHVSSGQTLPEEWSETTHVTWKTEIPGKGWSSPVVIDNEIWLTTSIDEKRSLRVICVDKTTGALRQNIEVFSPEKLVEKHDRNGHATPTPVIDGDYLYVHFGSYGTAAVLRADGKIAWKNQDTVIQHQWGPGSSPIVHDEMIIFNCDGMDLRYVIALDKRTGKMLWKTDRSIPTKDDGFFRKAFSTPLVATSNGKTVLLTGGANQLSALDPQTGKEQWNVEYYGFAGVATPITSAGRAFVTTGYGDAALLAVQLDDSESFKPGDVVWRTNRGAPIIPTPIVVDKQLYMISDNGVLTCVDAATGKPHWRERLRGNFAASILYGDGKLYVHNDQGETTVFEPSPKAFKPLATNQLDSNIQASPAVHDGTLFIRTEKSLYRIE